MANPNPKPPPLHSRFKKGEVANPLGGRAHNPALKRLKNLTEDEMVEIGSMIVKGSIDELKAIGNNPKAGVLKMMMASVALNTIKKGDAHALEILLTRLIGKPKDRVEVVSTSHTTLAGEVGVYDASKINAALDKLERDV